MQRQKRLKTMFHIKEEKIPRTIKRIATEKGEIKWLEEN